MSDEKLDKVLRSLDEIRSKLERSELRELQAQAQRDSDRRKSYIALGVFIVMGFAFFIFMMFLMTQRQ